MWELSLVYEREREDQLNEDEDEENSIILFG
jgi:hypothetical protein